MGSFFSLIFATIACTVCFRRGSGVNLLPYAHQRSEMEAFALRAAARALTVFLLIGAIVRSGDLACFIAATRAFTVPTETVFSSARVGVETVKTGFSDSPKLAVSELPGFAASLGSIAITFVSFSDISALPRIAFLAFN